ncbi:MAG: LppU/SCO3897 family protein [Pseudonocardiaceae bacterium]
MTDPSKQPSSDSSPDESALQPEQGAAQTGDETAPPEAATDDSNAQLTPESTETPPTGGTEAPAQTSTDAPEKAESTESSAEQPKSGEPIPASESDAEAPGVSSTETVENWPSRRQQASSAQTVPLDTPPASSQTSPAPPVPPASPPSPLAGLPTSSPPSYPSYPPPVFEASTAATPASAYPSSPPPPQQFSPQASTPPPAASPPPLAPQATTPGYTEPATRPKGSRRGIVIAVAIIAIILLVLCGVLGYLFFKESEKDNAHKAGKCIEQSGNAAKPVDCDSPKAYKIIKRVNDTQSDKDCPAAETELYFVNESKDYVLCLKKNQAAKE